MRLGDTFALALIGQILVAIAQPPILNAVTEVPAAGALPERQRANGIALGTARSSPAPRWRCRSARRWRTRSR